MDLKILGLNDYEAKTYEMLVKLGKATAASIAKQSGVPYGRVYDVLASLELKGLLKVLPGKTKMYVPGSPDSLLEQVKKKQEDIAQLEKDIQELKQVYVAKEAEPVLVAQGKANFFRLAKERDRPKKFNYSIKYVSEPRPEWLRQEKEELAKGVDVRSLTKYDAETKENILKFLKVNKNYKQIENDGVAMAIGETGILLGLIKSNTTLLIRDQAFINVMKDLFLAKYKEAKEIK